MSELKNRKQKAGNVRTEVFAMRLDPQLKFASELLARKQRRSLANLIEWMLDNTLRAEKIDDSNKSAWELGTELWDISEPRRFLNMATKHPDLLNFEEQCILSTIKNFNLENPNVGPELRFYNQVKDEFVAWAIDACWTELKEYALDMNNENLAIMLRKKAAALFEK